MPKQITQKTQGNGQATWIVRYLDNNGKDEKLPEILTFDPSDTATKTIKLTDYQLYKLMELLGEK